MNKVSAYLEVLLGTTYLVAIYLATRQNTWTEWLIGLAAVGLVGLASRNPQAAAIGVVTLLTASITAENPRFGVIYFCCCLIGEIAGRKRQPKWSISIISLGWVAIIVRGIINQDSLPDFLSGMIFFAAVGIMAWSVGQAIAKQAAKTARAESERDGIAETVRQDLAAELHDSAAKSLSAAIAQLRATTLSNPDNTDFASGVRLVERAHGELVMAMQVLGRSNHSNPHQTIVTDLDAELSTNVERLVQSGFEVSVAVDEAGSTLPPPIAQLLAKVLTETVENVQRYAKPDSLVAIKLDISANQIYLTVSNEIGCQSAQGSRMGLQIIRQRVEAAGGYLNVSRCENQWQLLVAVPHGDNS